MTTPVTMTRIPTFQAVLLAMQPGDILRVRRTPPYLNDYKTGEPSVAWDMFVLEIMRGDAAIQVALTKELLRDAIAPNELLAWQFAHMQDELAIRELPRVVVSVPPSA